MKLISAIFIFFMAAAWCGAKEERPEAMLAGMTAAVEKIQDYKGQFEWVEMKGKREDRRLCDFIFMKPDYQRIRVVEGSDKGSSAAYNPSKSTKKVAAKAGLLPAITLAKDSSRLGDFFEAGIQKDIEEVRAETTKAAVEKLGVEKFNSRETVKIQIVPEKPVEYSKIIIWIDTVTNLPLKIEYYKGGKFNSRKTWTVLTLNAGLKEKDFVP